MTRSFREVGREGEEEEDKGARTVGPSGDRENVGAQPALVSCCCLKYRRLADLQHLRNNVQQMTHNLRR